jgi:hypothetical protein
MTIDWWPKSLAHIPKEDPWAHDHVIVAEIKSFDDGGHMGTRFTISALVPIADLDAVRQNLAALDSEVRRSGPRPFPQEDRAYEPRFWIEFYGSSGGRYEPLVLSWRWHDHTVFVPEPGFLMTYGRNRMITIMSKRQLPISEDQGFLDAFTNRGNNSEEQPRISQHFAVVS